MARVAAGWLVLVAPVAWLVACDKHRSDPQPTVASTTATASVAPPAPAAHPGAVLLLGGDVELARATGKKILADSAYDPFHRIRARLDAADVRFVNLESQLSEQRGEVVKSWNSLVFTGPPAGADVLSRARIDVVSTANNHAWDYGRRAMAETIENLDRVGVAHAGTSRTAGEQTRAALVRRGGLSIAFLAFTAVWNQGLLSQHDARDHVADATRERIDAVVRALVASRVADVIVVSIHGGDEYQPRPLVAFRELLHTAARAGAHVVVGHHAHVFHGVSFVGQTPVFEGLGNFVMQMHRDHPETELGLLARVTLDATGATVADVCPHRIVLAEPEPSPEALREIARRRLVTASPAPLTFTPTDDGCFRVAPLR